MKLSCIKMLNLVCNCYENDGRHLFTTVLWSIVWIFEYTKEESYPQIRGVFMLGHVQLCSRGRSVKDIEKSLNISKDKKKFDKTSKQQKKLFILISSKHIQAHHDILKIMYLENLLKNPRTFQHRGSMYWWRPTLESKPKHKSCNQNLLRLHH